MTEPKISIKTLGLFSEMCISVLSDGYEVYPYCSNSSNPNHVPPYQWDDETALRIIRNSVAELEELNSHEKVILKQVKLPCQIVNERIRNTANPYKDPGIQPNSLFKIPSTPQSIFIQTTGTKHIDVKLNEKSYSIQEIDECMKSNETIKSFLEILLKTYGKEFRKTKNPYLDCMFLMHHITMVRISLPMRSDNDITTGVFGMVCAYANLSVSKYSSLYYKDTEPNLNINRRIVPHCTLEVGNLKSIIRKPSKPVVDSFHALLRSDLVHDFYVHGEDNYMHTKDDIETEDDLITQAGHMTRETAWTISLNIAKKWRRRILIFQLLYCSDLDEYRWIKFNQETKFMTAKKRAIEKQVIHKYCLDGLKIKPTILGCGPYNAKENDETKQKAYESIMKSILEIQGAEKEFIGQLEDIKNDLQHHKFLSSLLRCDKKPSLLIFDLSQKRLDRLENKSIHNNALLRFRTLFYADKMSLDTLHNFMDMQQRKETNENLNGCLKFDWKCERCLMSIIQSTLNIFSLSLKVCSYIIDRKINDEPEFDDFCDDDSTKKSKSGYDQVRSSFVIQTSLETFLPSAILELCFISDFGTISGNLPNYKNQSFCDVHETTTSNNMIIKSFENAIHFFEEKHQDKDLEKALFAVLLENKSNTNTNHVKTKTVDFLKNVIELGMKQQEKKKIKKDNDKIKTENDREKKKDDDRNKTDVKPKNSKVNDDESQIDGEQASIKSENGEVSDDDEFEGKIKKSDGNIATSHDIAASCTTIDSITHNTTTYEVEEFLRYAKSVYDDDGNFSKKLEEMLHVLSIDSQTNILILTKSEKEKMRGQEEYSNEDDDDIPIIELAGKKSSKKRQRVNSLFASSDEDEPKQSDSTRTSGDFKPKDKSKKGTPKKGDATLGLEKGGSKRESNPRESIDEDESNAKKKESSKEKSSLLKMNSTGTPTEPKKIESQFSPSNVHFSPSNVTPNRKKKLRIAKNIGKQSL